MNTSQIGNLTQAKVVAKLLELGYGVSVPFGDGSPYDLILDDGRSLKKVQCKTGRIRKGCVVFGSLYGHRSSLGTRPYGDLCDLFAIYCPDNGKTYLIRTEDITSATPHFRLDHTRNNQQSGIKWARDYEI